MNANAFGQAKSSKETCSLHHFLYANFSKVGPLATLSEVFSPANMKEHFIWNLPGIAILPMGFVALLSNGPNPKIMLAIDFRGPFCTTFWTSKK